ncbi:hypothetical protein EKO04_002698 [Ascochyta lentis]|uniref:Uncharacterized protein n=1 Tax=Ascochyta lentis TaxID=205686 RepID=A0A8H7ML47_9PLEO|nr:hypothetical protein EKO04_002698 [Ascochyta lentis]
MSTLLQLPRELRDQIYSYVVHVEKERPDLNQTFEQMVDPRMQRSGLAPRASMSNQTVLYLPQDDLNTFLPLLLVNHQMSAEISQSLSRIASPLTYSLDIVILDEILLLPTWLSVPVHRASVDTVNVTFRIAGSFKREKRYDKNGPYARFSWYAGFTVGDGGGPAMMYQLYEVLSRFMKNGAVGQVRDSALSNHVTAKCIKIDILTPREVPQEQFVEPLSGHRATLQRRAVQGGVLHPRYLANFVGNLLRALLMGSHHTYFEYGKLLFESVDEIVLFKDGVEFRRWDVAKCLQTITVEERYVSREQMRVYKEETWRMRKARGLKVLGD